MKVNFVSMCLTLHSLAQSQVSMKDCTGSDTVEVKGRTKDCNV